MEYCRWLNNLLQSELPFKMMLRLPTEAEWEKASRGTDGREYPWGNQGAKDKCNTLVTSGAFTQADIINLNLSREAVVMGRNLTTSVGLYSPQGDSPYGCADMSGNVWEWTHSEYKAYPYNAKDGRENERKNVVRVLRGGTGTFIGKYMRCETRFYHIPIRSHLQGFRVAIAPMLPS